MKIGVITISDTRSFDDDESGSGVAEALAGYGFSTIESVIIPSEAATIKQAIRQLSAACAAIFTIGGTGFSPRDITPEATADLLDRRADNLSELIRARCAENSPGGHLYRGVAGMIGNALVVNLPGSPGMAQQGIHAIGSLLEVILRQLRGAREGVGVGC